MSDTEGMANKLLCFQQPMNGPSIMDGVYRIAFNALLFDTETNQLTTYDNPDWGPSYQWNAEYEFDATSTQANLRAQFQEDAIAGTGSADLTFEWLA